MLYNLVIRVLKLHLLLDVCVEIKNLLLAILIILGPHELAELLV